ncbi:MAG: LytTR family DNA-binding domain-containing protein [Gemmatimonadota bacterium]
MSRPQIGALVWSFVAAAITAQQLVLHYLDQSRTSIWVPLAWKLVFLAIWAAATPAILASAARWPATGPRATRHLFQHAGAAILFIAATNLVVRLPISWGLHGPDVRALAHGALEGIVYYGPFALIVYSVILVVGGAFRPPAPRHRAASTPDQAIDPVRAPSPADTFALRGAENLRIIPVADIEWIEADGNYVNVAAGGEIHRARERLSDVEARLDPSRFIRIHRSAIVPIGMLRAVIPVRYGDWAVELATGRRLRVARGRRLALQAALASVTAPTSRRPRLLPNE